MEQEPIDRGSDAGALRAERARASGQPDVAARIAREALAHHDSPAAAVALALALLDLGETQELRRVLESLLEAFGETAGSTHREAPILLPAPSYGGIPDATLAAATAATLELVGSLDDVGFEQAFDEAEVEHELLQHADVVAEQVLEAIPAEPADEILPGADSPFATRTFADLLERQGHEAEAQSLRSVLGGRDESDGAIAPEASSAGEPRERVLATLERWLENLGRNAA